MLSRAGMRLALAVLMKFFIATQTLLILLIAVVGAGWIRTHHHPVDEPQAHQADPPADPCPLCTVYTDVRPSVVKIVAGSTLGAGVIADSNGHILTNAHVVRRRKRILVTLFGGEEREARVVWRDRELDLALLVLEDPPAGLQKLPLEIEAPVREGQEVIVIGHPIGFDWTITRGIVSGIRDADAPRLPNMIQIDAGTSPGNSGGPLLTLDGKFVGLITSKVRGGGAENLGFARPASLVQKFLEEATSDPAYLEKR